MAEKKTEISRKSHTKNSYDIFPNRPLEGTVVNRRSRDVGLPLAVLSWGESLRYDSNWFKHVNYAHCALEMILDGEMAYLSEGRRSAVRKGELFLMVPGSNARYGRTELAARIHKIHLIFNGPFVEVLLNLLGIRQDTHFKVDSPERFEKTFREIVSLLEENTLSSLRRSSVLLYELLLELSVFVEPPEKSEDKRLTNMIRFQDMQNSIPLGNRDLEKILFLKHSALNGLYKKNLGVTPHRYHRDRRLEQAAELLRTTSASVRETASMCGFANYKYFLVIFKKKFGITPGKYRAAQKKANVSPSEQEKLQP